MTWIVAFFILPGFCGLAYQVMRLHVAKEAFGVTTPVISIVLSVFMAGLAVGSWDAGCLDALEELNIWPIDSQVNTKRATVVVGDPSWYVRCRNCGDQ